MKLTLTTMSSDGNYTDQKRAEIGFQCPYAVKLAVGRYSFTIYRWSCPTICISKSKDEKNCGGAKEEWAEWVLWQDNPWQRFQWYRRGQHVERILCPGCGSEQRGVVEHTWPFYSYVHFCDQCNYTITESEWEKVKP